MTEECVFIFNCFIGMKEKENSIKVTMTDIYF